MLGTFQSKSDRVAVTGVRAYDVEAMSDSVSILEEMRGKLEAKRARLRTQLAAVDTEFQEIEIALRVLQRLASDPVSGSAPAPSSDNGVIILKFVSVGEDDAKPPKDIYEALRGAGYDLSPDLVRTQLWRMAKRGVLESENGRYWKAADAQPNGGKSLAEADTFAEYAVEAAKYAGGGFEDYDDDIPF